VLFIITCESPSLGKTRSFGLTPQTLPTPTSISPRHASSRKSESHTQLNLAMEKSFQFVDSANIDNITRKSIRSHVMKGKNARRTVHRQSRLSLTTNWLPPPSHKATTQRTLQAPHKDEDPISMSMQVSRNLGSVFLTFRFPIELTPHSIKVVNQCEPKRCMLNLEIITKMRSQSLPI
jgi:hypothetical protein